MLTRDAAAPILQGGLTSSDEAIYTRWHPLEHYPIPVFPNLLGKEKQQWMKHLTMDMGGRYRVPKLAHLGDVSRCPADGSPEIVSKGAAGDDVVGCLVPLSAELARGRVNDVLGEEVGPALDAILGQKPAKELDTRGGKALPDK